MCHLSTHALFSKSVVFLLVASCGSQNLAWPQSDEDCGFGMTLSIGQQIQVDSPDFPQSLWSTNFTSCRYSFINDPNSEQLVFVFVNGFIDRLRLTLDNETHELTKLDSNVKTILFFAKKYLHFQFEPMELKGWNAFQSIVYSSNGSCPFKTKNTFMRDVSSLAYFRSRYRDGSYLSCKPAMSCSWSFSTTPPLGLKIVLRNLYLNSGDSLTVVNMTGHEIINLNESIVANTFYRYCDDHQITVKFNSASHMNDLTGFEAVVTPVIHEPPTRNPYQECFGDFGANGTFTWRLQNELGGYEHDLNCLSQMHTLNRGSQMFVWFLYCRVEPFVDSFWLFRGEESHQMDSAEVYTVSTAGAPNVGVHFGFHSDGSIVQDGFVLSVKTVECLCAEEIIYVPCNGSIWRQGVIDGLHYYYCNNMICRFEIKLAKKCAHEKSFRVNIDINLSPEFDEHAILSDAKNNVVLNGLGESIFHLNESAFLYFKSKTKQIPFESISYQHMLIEVQAIENPSMREVILTPTTPFFLYDLQSLAANQFLTFSLSKEISNDSLNALFPMVVYQSYDEFAVYDPETLHFRNSFISLLEASSEPFIASKLKFNGTKLVIYRLKSHSTDSTPMFVRAWKAHTHACMFDDNVFVLNVPATVSMTALASGTCPMVFLASSPPDSFMVTQFWTNAETVPVTFRVGCNPSHKAFQFDANTAASWKNVNLVESFYAIEIPMNASVSIEWERTRSPTQITQTPFRSLLSGPGISPSVTNVSIASGIFVIAADITLRVKSLTVQNAVANLQTNNSFSAINKANETHTFTNTTLSVFVEAHFEPAELILTLEAESISETQTTVSTISTQTLRTTFSRVETPTVFSKAKTNNSLCNYFTNFSKAIIIVSTYLFLHFVT